MCAFVMETRISLISFESLGNSDDDDDYMICIGIHTSSNITLVEETTVVFFFGPRVLIPDDNICVADEQCFTIGLDCTVKNLPSLVDGKEITFSAYVETDNGVTTQTERITLVVSEPVLLCMYMGMCVSGLGLTNCNHSSGYVCLNCNHPSGSPFQA